ncbi:UNVERIFIED_CONTAM: protein ALWAYS EARLY 3 [Sesamum calycinum]|uniref:Protein ALWAYS EARLY 3 n=1 Tax=Sesamum calycinum TaxID=2727403 RepID=A0AAW2R8T9_9LAMI
MGPTRKSRSVNKRYSQVNEVSPSKDGDGSKRSNSRKRKLSDMLGPRWTMEELTRFYDSYRKNGKDWKKVANAVRNRSSEMAEALYTMNRAYLSLPHGTASAAGLIAMMTDHYCNLAGSDSDQESNDGVGSSQRTQKRARGKVQPPTSKKIFPHSPTITQVGLSVIVKEETFWWYVKNEDKSRFGTRPRPVGKRTPRFPVSYSYENINGEKYFSPTKQGLKLKANTDDDDVAHEVAIALAEASQRGGSPQVSGTPSKRAESVMSSPFRHAERKNSVAEMANEEDLEGSTEADTGELSGYKPYMMDSVNLSTRQKGTKVEGKKIEVDNNNESHLDNIKEECSGTEEGQRKKVSVSFLQHSDGYISVHEGPAFDALQTLADLSLMMQQKMKMYAIVLLVWCLNTSECGDFEDSVDDSASDIFIEESKVQFKDEHDDHVDESEPLEALPANQPREKRKSSGVRMKGHLVSSSEVASSKTSKPGKSSVFAASSVPEENHDSHHPITKTTRKKQKMQVSKIQKSEAHPDIHLGESLGSWRCREEINEQDQEISPKQFTKVDENFRKFFQLIYGKKDSAQSAIQETNCLLNQRLRRWCTYEWFYSAIDYPWFAKSEFVEYLYHVGLGHVPRLTRVEWGVIRSSLGKPRRFSGQFLKEEKEKLNQYRDSVRKHYTELREGIREGLPTDLARPLSVGQRVIAIHPKTREIHDGSVLTVDHSKCRVQFDRHELGVEFVMDIDCMPLNPLENMPALLGRHTVAVDKPFENFNELQINGRAKEYIKLSPGDNLDSIDGISQLPPLANPTNSVHQVASANTNVQTRIGPADAATYQQIAYSQPSTLAQAQAKEADVQALAELTRALDKKEAIVLELRRMNDDVLENQDGNSFLKESEPFKKQYAAVLIQLNEANEQVSSALHCLRERNTYQGKCPLMWPGPVSNHADAGGTLNSSDRSAYQTQESGSNVNEIMDSSRTKARKMVDVAMQAISSLKSQEDTIEKIEEAIDYVNDRLPSDDSCMPVASDPNLMNSSDIYTQIPSELITKCVATLLMIQKCTERQFPPSDVAEILDSAVTSLQPHSSQNLPVYTEIQKCVGIIKNQILALIPT